MKNIFYLMFLVLLTISCSKPKEIDPIFGDPTQRIADTLAYVRNTLIAAPNGWKASTTTSISEGGYGFYMQFSENDRLKMVADLDETSASEIKESTYRIRQIMYATLSFDTYNYITKLQDPNPDVYGGAPGKGLGSDNEYDYVKTHGDTLFFQGRKFVQPLILVKASVEESKKYLNGGYLQSIKNVIQFFDENAYPYVEVGAQKYQVTMNSFSKRVTGTTILPGNKVESSTEGFYFGLEGFDITTDVGLKLGDKFITDFRWIDNKLFAFEKSGEKHEVKNSVEPLMPLHLLIGSKYSAIYLPFNVILPGTSNDGKTMIDRYFKGLGNGATGYSFNCGEISLKWNLVNKRATLTGFASQNLCAGGWGTEIVYDYILDEETGVFKFTKRSGPSGGYTAAILDQLNDFFEKSSFKMDYQIDGQNVYGKILGIEKPGVEMTFVLN